MKKNKKYISQLLISLIFILSILSSCGIFKKTIKERSLLKKDTLTDKQLTNTLDSLKNHYFEFKTFYSGFKGKFEQNGKSIPLKGIIKIKKDTFIQISIRPTLGIELAKILLTNDSVKFLDKVQKQFIKEDYLYLQKKFGVEFNYQILQSILINRFFIYPKDNNVNSYKLDISENNKTLKLTSKGIFLGKNTIHELKILQNKFYIINNKISLLNEKRNVNILYSDFNKINNYNFPKFLQIKLSENLIKIKINIEYKNIQLNKSLKPSFSIPQNYKAVKFE